MSHPERHTQAPPQGRERTVGRRGRPLPAGGGSATVEAPRKPGAEASVRRPGAAFPYTQPLSEPAVSPHADAQVEVRHLYKRFDTPGWVIDDISLAVYPGELLCVLGPSGCGKTTLLRLVGGFEEPDHGEVLQRGRTISVRGGVVPPEQRQMGMVFQDYALFPHLTVRDNVLFGVAPSLRARVRQLLWGRERRAAAGEARRSGEAHRLRALMGLTGLEGLGDRYPHELSGGQQQRVALARALAPEPHLLLLDEPFSNLDTTLRQRIRDEVKDVLRQAGTTSVLVTHDQEEAINMGDRLAIMNGGRLEQVGAPQAVLERPASRFVAAFIGMSRFLRGERVEGGVRTALGLLPADPADLPDTVDVDVLVRPNQLQLCGETEGTPATVGDVRYLGGQPLYTLHLPSGETVLGLFASETRLKPDQRVGVAFRPRHPVCFARG